MTRTQRTILTVGEDGRVTAILVGPPWPRLENSLCCNDTSQWLWTWKVIGQAVNRSERWARRMGKAGRLPVTWVDGRPGITVGDLYAWLKSGGPTSY